MRAISLCALTLLGSLAAAEVRTPMMIFDAAANKDTVVFTWAGQLWSVSIAGGTAKRMFNEQSDFRSPYFSRDGSQLAFAKVGADIDIYVMPAAGGERKQVTDHPKTEIPQSWGPDNSLIFSAGRERDAQLELYRQGVNDPMAKRLPMPRAINGSLSPNGNRIAYVANAFFGTLITRRAYRGGDTSVINVLDLKTLKQEQITKGDHNCVYPMWVDDRIYYASDSRGSFNLAVYDLKTKKTTELTDFANKGITYVTYSSNLITYVRGGRIYLYDLASGKSREVPVTIPDEELKAPIDERAARQVSVAQFVQWTTISNDGKAVLFEGRGDIWMKPIEGEVVNLTKTPGAAERLPAMSPDGKMIAYFSDASGEYQLAFHSLASGETRMFPIEDKPTYYRELTWSPDSKRLAFSDLRLGLWVADDSAGKVQRVDSSPYLAQEYWHPTWAGENLVYSKANANGVRALYSWSSGGKIQQLTDGYTPAELPTAVNNTDVRFAANAQSLFAAGRGVWGLQSAMMFSPIVASQMGTVSLGANPVATPFGNAAKDLVDLKAGKDGVIFAQTQNWGETPGDFDNVSGMLYRISPDGRKWDKLASGIQGFEISADGSTLVYIGGRGAIKVLPADAPAAEGDESSAAKAVSLGDARVELNPAVEWKQIFHETFRMMRDRFYDANHHGQDMGELERHYAEYLPNITRRNDLNALLLIAFGEVSVSHLRVGGGDTPRPQGGGTVAGLLGVDWAVENNRYRIAKLFRQSDVMMTSSLVQQILSNDVKPGMYLIEVEGQQVTADKSIYSYFVGKAGKEVKLGFSNDVSGSATLQTTARPVPGENTLRMLAWAEENRRKVDQMSGGKLEYVYIPGYDPQGYINFIRALFASKEKEGLIIDQRFNGGGITSDIMVEALMKTPILAYQYPYGNDFTVPAAYVNGPKVLIINEGNGSAAETFALMFKNLKAGTVVGTRTYGGGIGGGLSGVQLIDGGSVTIPNRAGYNPLTGKWEIENDGVRPDIEVEITPADFAAGRDPQLRTAVKTALQQLKTWKKFEAKRPRPPVHPGGRG